MSRKTLVAVAQMTARGSTEGNWEVCKRLVQKAVEAGAAFLALPEGFHFIGTHFTQSLAAAEPLSGPTISRYQALAKQSGIWLSLGGFQEKGPDEEHVYNSHVLIDPEGAINSVYRKMHLFDVEYSQGAILSESRFTAAGKEIVVAGTPFGTLGMSTCYDLRFPELYCKMVYEQGANILLVPSAFTVPTGKAHWEILLRARAIEMQSYVIAAAQVGNHSEKRKSYGHAIIISPWGEVLADCGDEENNGDGLIKTAEIDLDYLETLRAKMPCAKHRRADVLIN